MKGLEIEFKYKASIDLERYKEFCASKNPVEYLSVSGHDHFYDDVQRPGMFWRHRVGAGTNELTFKKKTNTNNNYVRVERNVDLADTVTKDEIAGFCRDLDFQYNTSLFKMSFIYVFDWYITAYYICYDTNMTEIGRFIEIEIRDDYEFGNEQTAWNELLVLEKVYGPLGLSPKTRIKDSLFEIFGRKVA